MSDYDAAYWAGAATGLVVGILLFTLVVWTIGKIPSVRTRHLVRALLFFLVALAAAVALFRGYKDDWLGFLAIASGAAGLSFLALWIRAAAILSPSRMLRFFERVRAYVADETPSFEEQQPKTPRRR